MKLLFETSSSEYKNALIKKEFPLQCYFCEKTFLISKKRIGENLKYGTPKNKYCNKNCHNKSKKNGRIVKCTECSKEVYKTKSSLKSPGNQFCSSSCAAIFNHKAGKIGFQGRNRSKLEKWLEIKLNNKFDLKILYNSRKAIQSELDIWIPSLQLAFEINGIIHYKPIYGEKKFNNIQKNDKLKISRCKEQDIDLKSIKVNSNENSNQYYLNQISEIILSKI